MFVNKSSVCTNQIFVCIHIHFVSWVHAVSCYGVMHFQLNETFHLGNHYRDYLLAGESLLCYLMDICCKIYLISNKYFLTIAHRIRYVVSISEMR